MRHVVPALTLLLLVPGTVSASSITSYVSSVSSTGGNSSSGGRVVTGEAHASAESRTVVGTSSGDVHVEVSATNNGATETRTQDTPLPATGAALSVAAVATSGSTSISIGREDRRAATSTMVFPAIPKMTDAVAPTDLATSSLVVSSAADHEPSFLMSWWNSLVTKLITLWGLL